MGIEERFCVPQSGNEMKAERHRETQRDTERHRETQRYTTVLKGGY